MTITQENRVTYDDMSQNFPNIAKMVDRTGSAVVMKDNIPRYVILDFARIGGEETATNAEVMESARNLIARHLPAFQELAK
ncbi:prevent-host-death protein [Spirochaetia bacterium]|nr:prevent-host-death protein [Spirochaetia bacterium]